MATAIYPWCSRFMSLHIYSNRNFGKSTRLQTKSEYYATLVKVYHKLVHYPCSKTVKTVSREYGPWPVFTSAILLYRCVLNTHVDRPCWQKHYLFTICYKFKIRHIFPSVKSKVKFSHTRYRALGPELIPVYRQSARRWREVNYAIDLAVSCHYFLPGLRLPP